MHIWTGGRPSESARKLATALQCKRLRHDGTRRIDRGVIVNWGCGGQLPERMGTCRILNDPLAVQVASNKLAFFEAVGDGARTPEWTTNRDLAVQWREAGITVVCRLLLRASGGDGIVICEPGGIDIPHAPLYTKYVPKTHEYRVHIRREVASDGAGDWAGVIMVQRKVRRPGVPVENWKVRNLENGFIYQLEDLYPPGRESDVPPDVIEQAQRAIYRGTTLHFGAVDVMWHEGRGLAYVLEINTAPGLEERTARKYAEALKQL